MTQEQHERSFVLMSGGLDSTVLACLLKTQGKPVTGVAVDYGQRHSRELQALTQIAEHLCIEVVRCSVVVPGLKSSQTDPSIAVPHGHYADENMRVTVVPNRNMMMLSMAAAVAISRSGGVPVSVAIGAHRGDHPVYNDCREEFIDSMRAALHIVAPGLAVRAPFISFYKSEIVAIGPALGAPLHLTWSCYEGREVHCGKCGTCVERREAFELAGVHDPTIYGED